MDLDYLVYFDKEMKVVGFEMSDDDKQALQIRYKTPENCGVIPKIPAGATHFLEVFGVSTTLAFMLDSDTTKQSGELLSYRPSPMELAREIGKTLEQVLPIDQKDAEPEPKKCDVIMLPQAVSDARMKDILDRVPYPNWMQECWGTIAWIKIWKEKPELQHAMLEFSAAKYKEKEQEDKAKCIYFKSGECIIKKGVFCGNILDCVDFETAGGKR